MNSDDVKFFLPERVSDEANGGGRMTGDEIQGDTLNELFDNVDPVDRAGGEVSIRKLYQAVRTATNEKLSGAYTIIDKPPTDEHHSFVLFSTRSHTDEREQAQSYVEGWLVPGPESPFIVYELQRQGMMQISLYSRTDARSPEVGDVYYLVANEGETDEYSQAVAVSDISFEDRAFTLDGGCGSFTRRIWTLGLKWELQHDFQGADITCLSSPSRETICRTTAVADAARYYGVERLNSAASAGTMELAMREVRAQIVPSTRTETGLTDIDIGHVTTQIVSGSEIFDISGPAHTQLIEISVNNLRKNYSVTLAPLPASGTVSVFYSSFGRWYELSDNADGTIGGGLYGSGVYSTDTGSLQFTTKEYPDVGGAIIIQHGTPAHFVDRSGYSGSVNPRYELTLLDAANPGSVTVAWSSGGVDVAATDDSAGNLSGAATGTVFYSDKKIFLEPSAPPDANAEFRVAYERGAPVTEVVAPVESGGAITFSLPSANAIKPGSITLRFGAKPYWAGRYNAHQQLAPDGDAGGYGERILVGKGYGAVQLHAADNGVGAIAGGTVDYNSAIFSIPLSTIACSYNSYFDNIWDFGVSPCSSAGDVTVEYLESGQTFSSIEETFPVPPLVVDLLPGLVDQSVPGTVRFSFGDHTYSDRSGQGLLYWPDGTLAGTYDYAQNQASISQRSGPLTLSIQSLVSLYGEWGDYQYYFRIPASPLAPGGTTINATAISGDLISEPVDLSGNIASANAVGTVDQDTGVCAIAYGALVADATLTAEEKAEPWYDPEKIDQDGNIWRPTYIFPSTLRANTTAYTYLPIDPDILGLNPVRLPSDGRVPIFRSGSYILIAQEDTFELPNPAIAAESYDLDVERLASVELLDQSGARVDTAHYSADLYTGTITMADELNLSGFVEPLTAHYRFEDFCVASDVRVDNVITLTSALQHEYDPAKATVSTALLHGDLQARYHTLLHQTTWTGVWSDVQQGDSTLARYNDAQYPIALDNLGAIKGRWLIKFTSDTAYELFEEELGLVAVGSIGEDLSPLNPYTDTPYLTIYAAGFGLGGFVYNNAIRFNTEAAAAPMYALRSIMPGAPASDIETLCLRGRGAHN